MANSQFVSTRIKKYYGRDSEVIYPPVPVHSFDPSRASEDFYLWVGQLVPYKRPDLLVEAFNVLDRPLVVIGDGQMLPRLRRAAKPHIRLLGKQSFEVIVDHYSRCRAVVFPGVEDFGIVPVEAMASGKPVIAFDYGGARETVKNGVTGILFREQTANSLAEAIRSFESHTGFDARVIRAHAEGFSEDVFEKQFRSLVSRVVSSPTEIAANSSLTGPIPHNRISASP